MLRWFEPSAALAPFVQRIWSAQWRIPAGVITRKIENYLLAHAPKHDALSVKARETVEVAENDREIVSMKAR